MNSRTTGEDTANLGENLGSLAFIWMDPLIAKPLEPDPRFVTFNITLSKNSDIYEAQKV